MGRVQQEPSCDVLGDHEGSLEVYAVGLGYKLVLYIVLCESHAVVLKQSGYYLKMEA